MAWLRRRVPGCADIVCDGRGLKHRNCEDCGSITAGWTVRVDEETLRRKRVYVCDECQSMPGYPDKLVRRDRTLSDWSRDKLADQFPGRTRSTLRGFVASDHDYLPIPNLSSGALQYSIQVLGLDDEIYAEQRGKTAYLRKVSA